MPTPLTTVRRRAPRGRYDRAVVDAILDEGTVCHVALTSEGGPVVLPTGYVRIGDELVVHGAVANALMRQAADGRPLCIAVTLLDGLVLARSTFKHSMNYRSVVVFGRARVVEGDEKAAALARFVDHIAPGRSGEARAANDSELRATLVLAVRMDEVSAKVRTGPPLDDEDDLPLPVWAGVVPLGTVVGRPQPDPALSRDVRVPPSVERLVSRSGPAAPGGR
ncbi:MAG: pyridoxamine 5'-phosphate oxidase family protein [Actinobacteria bacterium]|nr:pyridoxamine 5'-phosphate oxidase family protein [Actinomycetota bacterium]